MKRTDITPDPSLSSPAAPSHEEISLRAHQLWCQQGCPQGHDIDNWMEAQRQLLSEYANRSPIPASEDVDNTRIVHEDTPFSPLADQAPLATRVEEQVTRPGRPASRESATSLDL